MLYGTVLLPYYLVFHGNTTYVFCSSLQVADIHAQLCENYPMDKLNERRLKRDKSLAALAKLKRQLAEED